MCRSDGYQPLLEEVDFVLAEQRLLSSEGPHFIVKHGYHVPGTFCVPGETVEEVCLWENFSEYPLLLAPTPILLFDCLRRFRRLTAATVEEIMLNHAFYTDYGLHCSGPKRHISIPRRLTTKVYISRIHEAMARAFREAGLRLDPKRVLLSESIGSNMVTYRLKGQIEVVHLDSTA